MKLTAVIMAGGRGERFWPRSRTAKPKQFLSLTADKETMLQKTVNRLKPLLEMDAIYVVTNQRYAALVQEQLPETASRKHSARTMQPQYSSLYWTGGSGDSETLRGSHDAGIAV